MNGPSVSGKTCVCGVIGDPIEHTMSPAMHNAASRALGLDMVYVAFHVRAEDLRQAIDGMRGLAIRGLNVTIPHKVAVMALLDSLDPLAERVGAVNTVVNNDGRLTGYNTDASGFIQPLLQRGTELDGRNAVVLGAGGAARAICFALAEHGTPLTILNRREEIHWAVSLADRVSRHVPAAAAELNEENARRALANAFILVNATSVGMSPRADAIPIPASLLRPDLVVYDVVYNPVKTRLLREAEQAGAQTIRGLEMLAWQGALSFRLWTGADAPVELMLREAERLLAQ